jgi:hypothetical protein
MIEENNNKDYARSTPINELDLQLMIVDNEWGKDIAPELAERLVETGGITAEDGKYKIGKRHLWGLLTYYTRDMRLSNLDRETFINCVVWLDYAGDCLRLGYVKSFLTSLSRVITMLELSQSRGGFLRRRLGTFTQESYSEHSESEKKQGLFGSKKDTRGGN